MDKKLLIKLVHETPIIWDRYSHNYHNKIEQKRQWRRIATELKCCPTETKRAFTELSHSYRNNFKDGNDIAFKAKLSFLSDVHDDVEEDENLDSGNSSEFNSHDESNSHSNRSSKNYKQFMQQLKKVQSTSIKDKIQDWFDEFKHNESPSYFDLHRTQFISTRRHSLDPTATSRECTIAKLEQKHQLYREIQQTNLTLKQIKGNMSSIRRFSSTPTKKTEKELDKNINEKVVIENFIKHSQTFLTMIDKRDAIDMVKEFNKRMLDYMGDKE